MDLNVPTIEALDHPERDVTRQAAALLTGNHRAGLVAELRAKMRPQLDLSYSGGPAAEPEGSVHPYTFLEEEASRVSAYPFDQGEEFVGTTMGTRLRHGGQSAAELPQRVRRIGAETETERAVSNVCVWCACVFLTSACVCVCV